VKEFVNLLVDLRDERFDTDALSAALRGIEGAGYSVERASGDDRFFAWLDDEFGGSWSSEAFAGTSIIVRDGTRNAGFATYDPRGLTFTWLRGLATQPHVGLFGPFGVDRADRTTGIGPRLLIASLASLRERGYTHALIPAVGEAKLVDYYEKHAGATVAESFPKAAFFERRIRTLVMASGNGSNFAAVLENSRDGRLPIDVAALVCNNESAYAIERAEAANIASVQVVPWRRDREDRAAYDERLLAAVAAEEPELVLLLGWMHVFSKSFVRAFPDAINLHPAYLPLDQSRDEVGLPDGSAQPAFRGPRGVREALQAKAAWIGATVHRLSLATDRGSILIRKPLAISPDVDEAAAMELLRPIERRVVSGGIMRWIFERP
jgi:phosphoribosylglycinamide formyltransferase-1